MSLLKKVQAGIHIFVGLGAIFGGAAAIYDPTGNLVGIDADVALRHGPFDDFLIPGLFLFVIIGLGNLFVAWAGMKNSKIFPLLSFSQGGILALWIVVQCIILAGINQLHVIFFVVGAVMMALAVRGYKTDNIDA
jgi:hypothetical protein